MTINEIDIIENMNVNAISFKNEMHSFNLSVSLFVGTVFVFSNNAFSFRINEGTCLTDFNLSTTKNQTNEMSE